nr:peptidylprolyl isomerase [candidate division Zixibacteria bacterium]
MDQAKDGNTVKVHYTGKLEDGTVFDSSHNREPLSFTLGQGGVIPGFENGVRGMKTGESKTVTIPCEDAYGRHRNEMMVDVSKKDFPPDITPEVGLKLTMQRGDGQNINVTIAKIEDETVTLDANHPLCDKTLIFEIELLEVA